MVWPRCGPRQGNSRGQSPGAEARLCVTLGQVSNSLALNSSIYLVGAESIKSTPRPRRPVLSGDRQLHSSALTLGHGLWGRDPAGHTGSPGRPIPEVKPAR